ncbi:MAG TPA: 16S rRNA (cytosine(1402)-N(4))-methyltransferase RsmH [Casimicrobiaceae bacterium]|nr:16S rRNA (cytosine(1402)-N(4))-methyltransferase RsmH [Casimicrobiaceae bacterium]
MIDEGHVPVLVDATTRALVTRDDGVYVDATFGRGGHARALLERLHARGRVVALDRDPEAEEAAERIDDPRFVFRRAWFSDIGRVLDALAIDRIDGALFDLGISSPQIDDPARGFSLRRDGPLDMRMDPSRGESAADFLQRATVRELTEVLRDYGEERRAQSIAKAVAAARARAPIARTGELRRIVAEAVGARTRGDWRQDPATRTFQALRIHVNRELDELSRALPLAARRLNDGTRVAVISFHSLEDRIVKRFFARLAQPFAGDARLRKAPLRADALPVPPLALVGRAVKPDEAEVARNPRARSAILRVAQRTGGPWPSSMPAEGN